MVWVENAVLEIYGPTNQKDFSFQCIVRIIPKDAVLKVNELTLEKTSDRAKCRSIVLGQSTICEKGGNTGRDNSTYACFIGVEQRIGNLNLTVYVINEKCTSSSHYTGFVCDKTIISKN